MSPCPKGLASCVSSFLRKRHFPPDPAWLLQLQNQALNPSLESRKRLEALAALAEMKGGSELREASMVRVALNLIPEDFVFRLTPAEQTALMSQFATSKAGRGGHRKPPWAFTEHGAIQAANVFNSPRAVEMGVHVVRAFVQLRELLASNQELARRLDQLEARIEKKLVSHDEAIAAILSAIRELMNPPLPKRRGIGFTADISEPK